MAQRRVVFVADDLGVSAGVNEGIAQAARAGIVREASLCVTGSAVAEGVRIAKDLSIGIGLHLSFTLGRSLTGPIRGMTDAAGNFFGIGKALVRCQLRLLDRAAVLREVEAQLLRLRDLGVVPTHANGHHHSHCWPVLRAVCAAAFARAGIRWTRLPAELPAVGRWQPLPLVLTALAAGTRRAVLRAGMRTLPFLGSTMEARVDHAPRFLRALSRLPVGDCEWMVHPRVPDAEFTRLDPMAARLDAAARAELATLTGNDLRAALSRYEIESVRYQDLA
ncbi:MAG: ChbG/HpnK family deacetylase [Planctomycetota bacterium]|nr:ChbG/HpnK family deacetylase [Planctomycetota bacterium]MSR38682.1 ChbG/HpnK family deacetylase [Planctomycetota bacterium]